MKYVSAYLLAVTAGKENPTAEDLRAIFAAIGSEVRPSDLLL